MWHAKYILFEDGEVALRLGASYIDNILIIWWKWIFLIWVYTHDKIKIEKYNKF